jgi:hypothetical protein
MLRKGIGPLHWPSMGALLNTALGTGELQESHCEPGTAQAMPQSIGATLQIAL